MAQLVLPLVSAGNVPQLAVDLLLHSLPSEFQYLESVQSLYLHPFIGALDYVAGQGKPLLYTNTPAKRMSTALELFHSEKHDIYVLQQRTPVVDGYLNNFIKETIIPLIKRLEITNAVILDSFSPLDDIELLNSTQRGTDVFSTGICHANSVNDVTREFQTGLKLDPETSAKMNTTLFEFTPQSKQQEIFTTQQVFKMAYHLLNTQLPQLSKITYCSLYVNEGDNSMDAQVFCQKLNSILKALPMISSYTPPASWQGLYGVAPLPSTFDEGLYI